MACPNCSSTDLWRDSKSWGCNECGWSSVESYKQNKIIRHKHQEEQYLTKQKNFKRRINTAN